MNTKDELRSFLLSQHQEKDKAYVDLNFNVANRYAYIQEAIIDFHNLKAINRMLLQIELGINILPKKFFEEEQRRLIRQGLWHSLVVGYAKYFVQGKMKFQKKDHLKGADPILLELHDQLMQIRHKFIAHGDHNLHEDGFARFYIEKDLENGGYKGKLGNIGMRQFGSSKDELEGIDSLIDIVLKNLKEKSNKFFDLVMNEIGKEPFENWIDKCENKNLLL